MYVGSTSDFAIRWRDHRANLNKNRHCNNHLQRAWNKYGEDSFEFSEIEFVDLVDLITKEQHYLNLLRPEYNICPTAGSSLGVTRIFSDEHRRKIGAASRIYMKGKRLSEETKLKISTKLKGRTISEEIRQNMRVPKRTKQK